MGKTVSDIGNDKAALALPWSQPTSDISRWSMEVSHEHIQGVGQEQGCGSRKKPASIKWNQCLTSLSSSCPLQWNRTLHTYPTEWWGRAMQWSILCALRSGVRDDVCREVKPMVPSQCVVSYLWTLNLPGALPNLNPGIKLPFATTSHMSWQFRQLTAWWSILLSGLWCKMKNWEQFCCTLD